MLSILDLSANEVIFTHVINDEIMQIAVSRIAEVIRREQLSPVRVAIDENFALECYHLRGIELHRLARIDKRVIVKNPVYYLDFGDSKLLCDGHHRYYRAYELGLKSIRAFVLPQELWKPLCIDVSHADPTLTRVQLLQISSGLN